jgi:hypothetical protein
MSRDFLSELTPMMDLLNKQVDLLTADTLGDTADAETKAQMGHLTGMLKSQLGNLNGLLRGIMDDQTPVEESGEPGILYPTGAVGPNNSLMNSLYQRRLNSQMGRRGAGTYDPTDAAAPASYAYTNSQIGVPGANSGGVYDPKYFTG